MLLKALQHPNIISLISMHMHVQDLSLCLAFPYAETGAGQLPGPRRCLPLTLPPLLPPLPSWHAATPVAAWL
jgi:hypothetical protein